MAIIEEASESALEEAYRTVLEETKIEPISQPKVEIMKLAQGNPFEFKITVTLLPEIRLPDYKKIALDTQKKEVIVPENPTPEEVEID